MMEIHPGVINCPLTLGSHTSLYTCGNALPRNYTGLLILDNYYCNNERIHNEPNKKIHLHGNWLFLCGHGIHWCDYARYSIFNLFGYCGMGVRKEFTKDGKVVIQPSMVW